MTDRATVNKKVDNKLGEELHKQLHSYWCAMHPLDSLAKACDKCLQGIEMTEQFQAYGLYRQWWELCHMLGAEMLFPVSRWCHRMTTWTDLLPQIPKMTCYFTPKMGWKQVQYPFRLLPNSRHYGPLHNSVLHQSNKTFKRPSSNNSLVSAITLSSHLPQVSESYWIIPHKAMVSHVSIHSNNHGKKHSFPKCGSPLEEVGSGAFPVIPT